MNLEEKERIEIEFWKNSPTENPTNFSTKNLLNKLSEAKVFYGVFKKHEDLFQNSETILELGGGQGWASCLIKKEYSKKVYLSDISNYAIESLKNWEKVFGVKIDHSFACKSYEIPLEDNSVDLVFAFAAAHHFVKHKKTLKEVKRVLKKGGRCIYMYEPSCRKFLYPLAYKRVNKKRPHVPEDVLITKEIMSIATDLGLKSYYEFHFSTISRGPVATMYYYFLGKMPFLANIIPCTCNYVFQKQ
ncbi:class I SAM-dependent methyltransferase [Aquimarina sp. MMG015]|uniref:class I SAM-dependent methyltransferase n=1 Tax=Aquimarina sp. MMG015 TaxID=2822689 RepID=UPI001B3A1CE4|nr:class I SAM-dependent methyltransferase [Aquimarina sp. MMG015]MBQ4801397.1 class I SAM-dependent methyltransferase [Aquimarina sp. MMG015]